MLVALATTGGRPTASRTGKLSNEATPTVEVMIPATNPGDHDDHLLESRHPGSLFHAGLGTGSRVMGPEWVAIIALVALFVVGTVLPINMGALAYVAAWLVGMYSLDLDEKEILAGVSGDLILTLIGVTYLFAIARNNGTVDLIVRSAVRGVGGRVALIPWVMFAVTAVLTAIGAVSPAACAIIGPIALGFAGRYGISPLMMGMFVVHGAQAGGFSPISIYGTITNSVMSRERPAEQRDHDLPVQPGDQHDPRGDPVRRPRWPEAAVAAHRPGARRRPAGRSVARRWRWRPA